ncbi:transposase [Actinomyces bowdenii]|uniref:transposase family protein n=1 Tax=Actinomyces bowdenii TaxID=131109 RepID=UPI00214C3BB1|nr:transposase family protein [Actinomyces bowdenii]MCR2053460.1 transposase [Actinomyces bowdenii]
MGPFFPAGAGRTGPACSRASTSAPGSTCKYWWDPLGACGGHPPPLPGATHDAKAITVSGILEEIEASCCIGDKGYVGTGITVPYKKPPNGKLTKAQKQSNKSLNNIRYVVERTIAHIKSWKILAHDYRRPLDTFKETITATLALYIYTNP